MNNQFPQAVKTSLWSYDTDQMDLNDPVNRSKVIFNVLNYGNTEAVDWIRDKFSKEEISKVILETSKSEWHKKSLSLWSLIFGVSPLKEGRFI